MLLFACLAFVGCAAASSDSAQATASRSSAVADDTPDWPTVGAVYVIQSKTFTPCLKSSQASYDFNLKAQDESYDQLQAAAADAINATGGFYLDEGERVKVEAIHDVSGDATLGPEDNLRVLRGANAGQTCWWSARHLDRVGSTTT